MPVSTQPFNCSAKDQARFDGRIAFVFGRARFHYSRFLARREADFISAGLLRLRAALRREGMGNRAKGAAKLGLGFTSPADRYFQYLPALDVEIDRGAESVEGARRGR